jgi:hypothetical protein
MRFFVFPEFKHMDLITLLSEKYPNIDFPKYGPDDKTSYSNELMLHILQTNAKLFYDLDDDIEEVLVTLESLGFMITDRRPCMVRRRKDGTEITTYMNDRVIFEFVQEMDDSDSDGMPDLIYPVAIRRLTQKLEQTGFEEPSTGFNNNEDQSTGFEDQSEPQIEKNVSGIVN